MRTTSLYPEALVSPFCLEVRLAGARWLRGALLVPLTPVSEAQSVPVVYPLRAGAESEAPSAAARRAPLARIGERGEQGAELHAEIARGSRHALEQARLAREGAAGGGVRGGHGAFPGC